jgi:rubrerythrin
MKNLTDKVLSQNEEPYDVLSLVFSNFEQASQKQKKPNLEKLFSLLSASFEIQAKNGQKQSILGEEPKRTLEALQKSLEMELSTYYPEGFEKATALGNRAVLRALTWGKKVSSIQNTLIKRFAQLGEQMIKENERIQVCQACGFIMVKDSPPEICPVCKAPAKRFVTL